jgi:hypothetical protein
MPQLIELFDQLNKYFPEKPSADIQFTAQMEHRDLGAEENARKMWTDDDATFKEV